MPIFASNQKIMAILHRKEEKLQVVLGRLPKKYTHEEFVEMFIKLYSKDWGKIKSAYIKQSQDKEPGTVVNMPKPDLYLKQVLETYLSNKPAEVVKEEPVKITKTTVKKKAEEVTEEKAVKKTKAKAEAPKISSKKKAVEEQPEPAEEVKKKAPAKKKTEAETAPTAKVKKAKA